MLTDVTKNSILEKSLLKIEQTWWILTHVFIRNKSFYSSWISSGDKIIRVSSWDEIYCKQNFFFFIKVAWKQPLKEEVQINAKNKAHICSSCNHHSSRYYSSYVTCFNNNVVSLLNQFITQKVRSNRIFGKSALFIVLTFWFLCI